MIRREVDLFDRMRLDSNHLNFLSHPIDCERQFGNSCARVGLRLRMQETYSIVCVEQQSTIVTATTTVYKPIWSRRCKPASWNSTKAPCSTCWAFFCPSRLTRCGERGIHRCVRLVQPVGLSDTYRDVLSEPKPEPDVVVRPSWLSDRGWFPMALVKGGRCYFQGCETRSSYGTRGTKWATSCARHASEGMVDLKNKLCASDGCDKHATYGIEGNKKPIFCHRHAEKGMVDVLHRRCAHTTCSKRPSFGTREMRKPEYCAAHALEGMIDVRNKRCVELDCEKHATYGPLGSRPPTFCYEHARDGMVNVVGKRCAQEGCNKHPSFGVAGSNCAIFCFRHAQEGMVGVRNKGRAHRGCLKCRRYGPTMGGDRIVLCPDHTFVGRKKQCASRGCRRTAGYPLETGKTSKFCSEHADRGEAPTTAISEEPVTIEVGGSQVEMDVGVQADRRTAKETWAETREPAWRAAWAAEGIQGKDGTIGAAEAREEWGEAVAEMITSAGSGDVAMGYPSPSNENAVGDPAEVSIFQGVTPGQLARKRQSCQDVSNEPRNAKRSRGGPKVEVAVMNSVNSEGPLGGQDHAKVAGVGPLGGEDHGGRETASAYGDPSASIIGSFDLVGPNSHDADAAIKAEVSLFL